MNEGLTKNVWCGNWQVWQWSGNTHPLVGWVLNIINVMLTDGLPRGSNADMIV